MATCHAAAPLPADLQRRNRRFAAYRELVRPIALHYAARCPEPLDDLIQVGLLGLLRAAELYREQQQTPFEAFARPHVRGAILHYLRDQAQPIRLPRRQQELLQARRQAAHRWQCQHGEPATPERLRQLLGLSEGQWQRLEQAELARLPVALDISSLDAVSAAAPDHGARAPRAGSDSLEDRHLDDIHLDAEATPLERGRAAQAAMAALEPGVAQVIRQVVLQGFSYRRTAALLGVSPMTVQRRLQRGLAQLRQALTAQALMGPREPARRCRAASAVPAC